MKTGLSLWQRVSITAVCFAIAIIGFMIKLPSAFRHIDKEMHATFYFLAAAMLNVLFAGTKLVRHVVIFVSLYLFGMVIEYAQAYSNKFVRRRIHGRFDPEDVQWNVKGLILFSAIWIVICLFIAVFKKERLKNERV